MLPPDEMHLPDDQKSGIWGRLTLWVSLNRPLAWLVVLTVGLVLFLAWLPNLRAHVVLARPADPRHPGKHDLRL
jgi:hypothetical protein